MTTDRTGLALAGVAAAGWAFAGIWVRLLPATPVATLVAARLALSLVLVAPLLARSRPGTPTPAAWGLAALMAAYYIAAVASFRFAPVAEATLFINASPLFAVGWALARGETVSRNEKAGTAAALLGVAVILLPGLGAAGDRLRLVGDALALGAGAAMAAYAVALRRPGAPGPRLVSLLAFALGVPALAVVSAAGGRAAVAGLETPGAWAALGGLALVSTAVPTLAFSEASRRLPSVLVTATRLLTPLVAAVAAGLVLGEVPSVWLVPGGALVLGGLSLAVRA